ncbi:MAG TPA: hypothetical protein VGW40_01960 [Allosphingosinicella sp.]|nr:hypothetical protein [Allosphingosinicella sp.]
MIRSLFALGAALTLASAAISQTPSPPSAQTDPRQGPDGAEYWTASDERMTFAAAGISFPRRAGAVRLTRPVAFGQRNAGLDNGLIYDSDDRALTAIAYVYLPGLAHEGLADVVSEHFQRLQSGAGFRLLGRRVAAAAGREGVAIRADYAGFRAGNEASSSAFLRAGRWIVKLRVFGPESRRADVERTLATLLEEVRFEGDRVPRPAEPIELGDCPPAAPGPAAALLAPNAAEAMEDAITAVAVGLRDEPSSFPRRWCVASFRQVGRYALPTLRALPAAPGQDSGRSVALAVLNDAGSALEIVVTHFRNRTRYVLLHHSMGRTRVLGAYDALPSEAQINAVLGGTDPAGGQARATIDYRANGDSTVTLHVMPDAPAPAP